jgi:predicted  nucleic acid-binding Zn-ribbon protein
MDSIQELEAAIEKIRRERFALRNRLDDPAVKQLDQQLAQQQIQLIEQVNKLNRAQQDPNAAPVQRGSNPLPPNVQTLVNKARQLSRSIAATGPAGPDSIAQALAIDRKSVV